MTVDDDVIRKIKSCLALSGSSNANEAATAMRQAQALMRRHGLSREDVEGLVVGDEVVKTTEGFGRCKFLAELVGLMHKAFGVNGVMERNPGSANRANIRYYGLEGRAQLAAYAHRVILRAVDDAWAEYLKHHPWHKSKGGMRTAFRLGWLVSVRGQVEAIGFSEEETQAIKAWEARTFGNQLVEQKPRQLNMDRNAVRAAHLGAAAGKGFQLHRPMGDESDGPLAIGVDS